MPNYLQIRPDLFLVEQSIVKKSQPKKKDPANHIWIYDRSGSMYGLLNGLVNDLKEKSRTLAVGDSLTLGWFSSEGEYNFILKGFRIASDADYEILDTVLDKNKSTLGTTCFSEILDSTEQVIEDLSVLSSNFSLCFFTDGYPVVRNYNKEIERIFSAVSKLNGKINSALMVGYGNYYNKSLLTEMAEKIGGAVTHSESLSEFKTYLDLFIKDSYGCQSKILLHLDCPTDLSWGTVFTVQGNKVILLNQESGAVKFSPSDEVVDSIYTLTSKKPIRADAVTLTQKDVSKKGAHEPLVRGLYAAAMVMCQKGKTDVAMDIVAAVGDVGLVDVLTNAYTPMEYGVAEKELVSAALNTSSRYVKGYKKDYLPDPEAYCLLDALDTLSADPQAYFYPRHELFEYKRVGVKAEQVDATPDFEAEPEVKVSVSDLVWNSKMLNLSLRARIPGKIRLTGSYKKLGLNKDYPTHVYRTYTLVKDGFLNMKSLPVSLSFSSFVEFQDNGLIGLGLKYISDKVYLVELDKVPVINRGMAEGRTSAVALADLIIAEYGFKGKLKSLKYYKDKEVGDSTEKVGVFAGLSDEQVTYLEKFYVTKNGFSPPVEKEEPKDFYSAKEFEVKVKGLSSFPKVEDVETKLLANKKLTTADQLVAAGIQAYKGSGVANKDKQTRIEWLNEAITDCSIQQRKVSREIQETKFAVLLAKKWFSEFKTREENVLEHKGHVLTFSLREVSVPY